MIFVPTGTGDNLAEEDLVEGMADYVLWSTFGPECLDMNEELPMNLEDGGLIAFKAKTLTR